MLVAALLTGLGIGAFTGTAAHALSLEDTAPLYTPVAAVESVDLPEVLHIPSLGLEARVQHVGVTAAGNMDTPSNFTDVGWYTGGAVPGMLGSAVVGGHVDNALSLAGVFKRLRELQVGDDLYIETAGGEVLHFVVEEVASYPRTEVPLQKVFNRTDGAWLNLITCDGEWVERERNYGHRLVVFAQLR